MLILNRRECAPIITNEGAEGEDGTDGKDGVDGQIRIPDGSGHSGSRGSSIDSEWINELCD